MKYSREIYQKVNKKLESSRKKAELESIKLKNSIFKNIPRLGQIEKKLASNSFKLVKNIFRAQRFSEDKKKLKSFAEIASNIKLENDLLKEEFSKILKQNNINPESLEPKYKCDKCDDTGIFKGEECGCKKKLLLKEATTELNKLSAFRLSTFDSFHVEYYPNRINSFGKNPRDVMTRVLANCREYSENFEKKTTSMLFLGDTGLGKTHLSLAIARKVIEKGFNAIYSSAQEIVKKCETEKFRYDSNLPNQTEYFSECDLLILDDLGAEFITSFSKSAIYEIINNRILRQKKTVISTNLSLSQMENIYSKRFISRLLGHYYRVEFCGDDIRTKIIAVS